MIIPDLYVLNDTTIRGEITLRIEGKLKGKTTDIEDLYVVNSLLVEKDATVKHNLYVDKGDIYANTEKGITGDWTTGNLKFEIKKGIITKIRKFFAPELPMPPLESGTIKYKIVSSFKDDRALREYLVADDYDIEIGKDDYGLFRWSISLPKGYNIIDATISYYVFLSEDDPYGLSQYWMLDSTNVQKFIFGDPPYKYADTRDRKFSGEYPASFPKWHKRNITSWVKWFYNHSDYKPGNYLGVKFGPPETAFSKWYQIRDKSFGEGKEAYIWIKYEI